MRITNGLGLVAAATSIAACGGNTATSVPHASAQVPVVASSQAVMSPAATDCRAQVQTWAVETIKPLNSQVPAVFGRLGEDVYASPSNLPADAGAILAMADHFGPQEPPRCASSLSRDWADYITSLIRMAAYIKLHPVPQSADAIAKGQALITYSNFLNSAAADLQEDLAAYGI